MRPKAAVHVRVPWATAYVGTRQVRARASSRTGRPRQDGASERPAFVHAAGDGELGRDSSRSLDLSQAGVEIPETRNGDSQRSSTALSIRRGTVKSRPSVASAPGADASGAMARAVRSASSRIGSDSAWWSRNPRPRAEEGQEAARSGCRGRIRRDQADRLARRRQRGCVAAQKVGAMPGLSAASPLGHVRGGVHEVDRRSHVGDGRRARRPS